MPADDQLECRLLGLGHISAQQITIRQTGIGFRGCSPADLPDDTVDATANHGAPSG